MFIQTYTNVANTDQDGTWSLPSGCSLSNGLLHSYKVSRINPIPTRMNSGIYHVYLKYSLHDEIILKFCMFANITIYCTDYKKERQYLHH